MAEQVALPPGLQARLTELAQQRLVFFAGMPGTGKSLLVHLLAHLAHAAGRPVHLLQWDDSCMKMWRSKISINNQIHNQQ